MQARFTKGPWKAERITGDYNVGIRVRGKAVSGYAAFINTRWPSAEQQQEQEANVALIVAAPDLYVALEGLTRWLNAHHEPFACCDDEFYIQSMQQANAALARAEGER